jgi:hypothetical protein
MLLCWDVCGISETIVGVGHLRKRQAYSTSTHCSTRGHIDYVHFGRPILIHWDLSQKDERDEHGLS